MFLFVCILFFLHFFNVHMVTIGTKTKGEHDLRSLEAPREHLEDWKTTISFNNIKILSSKFQNTCLKDQCNNSNGVLWKFQEYVHSTWINFNNIEISSSKFKNMFKKLVQATTMMELGAKSFKNMIYNQNLQQHSSRFHQWWSLELKVSRTWNTTKIYNNI
jgi:hypothetical protein